MDGLEGFKILAETTYSYVSSFWATVCIISAFIGFIAIVIMLSGFIELLFSENRKRIFIGFIIIVICGLGIFSSLANQKMLTQYKVTPIEDKYFIDLNRYEIVSQQGEIFEIREKLKLN